MTEPPHPAESRRRPRSVLDEGGTDTRVLFVGPHADDVCLSLGGLVTHFAAAKEILTVFSSSMWAGPSWPGPPLGEESAEERVARITEARTAEDLRYCALSGSSYRALGLPDTSARRKRLWDLQRPEGEEGVLRERVGAELAAVLGDGDFAFLVAPLGLGGHVDHVVSAQASKDAATATGTPVIFYEDVPYANGTSSRRIAQSARRLDGRVEPVLCETTLPLEDKVRLAGIYRTQSDQAMIDGMVAHNARLSRLCRDREERPQQEYATERIWTSIPNATLRVLLDPAPLMMSGTRSRGLRLLG